MREKKDEEIKDTFTNELKQAIIRGEKPERINELKVPIVFSP